MARKKEKKKGQLPSGNFRKNRLDYIDAAGKKHWKSFTGRSMEEVDYMIMQWKLSRGQEPDHRGDLTVSEAVLRYIESKAHVLSPSTLKAYHSLRENHIEGSSLGTVYLNDLTIKDVQIWISDLSRGHSPKSVRNMAALVRSSVEMFLPDFKWKVTLPQAVPSNLYCPSDKDVKRLLDEIRDKDPEMYRAVLLAAFGPMRRSEICALTSDDIRGNMVTVSKALVYDEVGALTVKTTKTVSSNRVIEYPSFVIKAISGIDGRIITSAPDVLSNRFKRTVKRLGGPQFRFHDLRHYAASIMHAIGVPDQYIMERGGWATDVVMKRVYRNVIDIEQKKQTKIINKHFQELSV